jgi:hypothetical protein
VDQSHLRRGARDAQRRLDCDWRRDHLPSVSAATGREHKPNAETGGRSSLKMSAALTGPG